MPVTLASAVQYDESTTRYLLRNEHDDLWWGQSTQTLSTITSTDPNRLICRARLDPSWMYPVCSPDTKRYEGDLNDPNVFIKTSNCLLQRDFDKKLDLWKALIQREVKVCEILNTSPHRNICTYLGVVTDTADRVIGIAYRRYDMDLFAALSSNCFKWSRIGFVLDEVRAGMRHMHSLGLVHCDLRPENIFLKGNGVVVGDFDSTKVVGETLLGKTAPESWWPAEFVKGEGEADVGIDEYMVARIEGYIEQWSLIHAEKGAGR